jgi:predicted DsbA family dithiol-disulfide isomerase
MAEAVMSGPLVIDVVSDVVCPWCYIGKRQLESAVQMLAEQHPEIEAPQVRWHPFQLNPDLPPGGMSRSAYMQRKFGTSDGSRVYQRVRLAASEAGLELKLDAIERQPNTLKAHALLAAAGVHQQALAERLFKAYFEEGADLTRDDELARLALEAGLDEEHVDAAINDADLLAATSARDVEWREMGVTGVPFFVMGNQVAVPGAAGAETLMQAMLQASRAA